MAAPGQLQPWSNFHSNKQAPSGYHAQCKTCRNEYNQKLRDGKTQMYVTCKRCGAELDADNVTIAKRICDPCKAKGYKWSKGVYLCVACDDRVYVGGHYVADDFTHSLEWGYWPEGMIVEHWYTKQFVGAYRVTGEQNNMIEEKQPQELELLDEYIPKGDRIYLKPGPPRLYWQGDPANEEHVLAAIDRFHERTGLIAGTISYREELEPASYDPLTFIHEPKLTPGLFAIGGK